MEQNDYYVVVLRKEELDILVNKLAVHRTVYPNTDRDKEMVLLEKLNNLGIEPIRNEYYEKLNERFDKRVEVLQSLGYKYYKEFVMFAKNEMSARNHNGIPNGVIMHCEDYHFNNLIGK